MRVDVRTNSAQQYNSVCDHSREQTMTFMDATQADARWECLAPTTRPYSATIASVSPGGKTELPARHVE